MPLTWSIRDTKELTLTDTRIVAHRWIEQHIPAGTRIAADPSTPSFRSLKVLPLQLPGPKRPFDPNRSLAHLRGLGIQFVIVTGAVTDRVLAARSSYPREAAFYDQLARCKCRVYHLVPGHGRAGPWVAIYAL